jgi:hypothetical protein
MLPWDSMIVLSLSIRVATSCEALACANLSGIYPLSGNRVFAEKLGYILLDVAGRSVLELLA